VARAQSKALQAKIKEEMAQRSKQGASAGDGQQGTAASQGGAQQQKQQGAATPSSTASALHTPPSTAACSAVAGKGALVDRAKLAELKKLFPGASQGEKQSNDWLAGSLGPTLQAGAGYVDSMHDQLVLQDSVSYCKHISFKGCLWSCTLINIASL
jgi:hypothetical protein